jgi:hypothetical protein
MYWDQQTQLVMKGVDDLLTWQAEYIIDVKLT